MSGKFIVIEGLDGSGKSTQIDLLRKKLKEFKIKNDFIHFPQINKGPYGFLISKFLRGEFGPVKDVNPYLVSILFAGDRKDYNDILINTLEKNIYVFADRYVYSNIAFQCAKIGKKGKSKLKKWILDFEFSYNKLVKPDLSIFLNVPFKFIKHNLTNNRKGNSRVYLQGKEDIHEKDLDLQRRVYLEYKTLIKEEKDIINIDCFKNNNILNPFDINNLIIKLLKEKKII